MGRHPHRAVDTKKDAHVARTSFGYCESDQTVRLTLPSQCEPNSGANGTWKYNLIHFFLLVDTTVFYQTQFLLFDIVPAMHRCRRGLANWWSSSVYLDYLDYSSGSKECLWYINVEYIRPIIAYNQLIPWLPFDTMYNIMQVIFVIILCNIVGCFSPLRDIVATFPFCDLQYSCVVLLGKLYQIFLCGLSGQLIWFWYFCVILWLLFPFVISNILV